ncbi:MAG: DUF4259 domain-containing protein [Gemmataceae bacterium]
MGAWSHDTFDNDIAADWAFELQKSKDMSLLQRTLAKALQGGNNYLDADIACEALAACDVVARLKGNWGLRNPFTEPADLWVEANPIAVSKELIDQANAVIDRVLSPPSELLELWETGKEPDLWKRAVDSLRTRVNG